jgi:hypothetical protein
MEKKRILYICSVNKSDYELRFIEEISVIESLLMSSSERMYDFFPKIGVNGDTCRRTVTGLYNEPPPQIVHFSLHGDEKRGLKFVQRDKNEPNYLGAKFFENLFKDLKNVERKINCVVFSACHSKALAEIILPYVDFAIGIDGEVASEAMLKFNERFYVHLLDGFPVNLCFKQGITSIKQWEEEEFVKVKDGGLPYSERIHLLFNP